MSIQSQQDIRRMARSFRQAQTLLTCLELGVFETLAGGSASAETVAAAIQADPRGVALLLNAAAALGLLEKQDELFHNSLLAESCLTMAGEHSIARGLRLESAFYRRWGLLSDSVRTGKRPEENRRDEQPADWARNFIRSLYDLARQVAPVIAEALALDEKQPLRVLDVGGGHGGYSIGLAQRYPLLSADVFELARVVPVAREIIAEAGMDRRITVIEGDFQKEALGSGYDLALVFGVLNGEPPEGRPELIRKVFSALNPGGRIVLRDLVLDPDRAGPADAALFALQMLLATDSGGLDTRADWSLWLTEAGFEDLRQIDLPEGVGSPLMTACKPG